MKPKNLSEVSSQDEFLEYLIDNYYRILGEGDNYKDCGIWHQYGVTYAITIVNRTDTIICEESQSRRNIRWVAPLSEYKDKIKALRNKPSFEDHPDAKCFVQGSGGGWWKNIKTSHVIAEDVSGSWTAKNLIDGDRWVLIQYGKVIGDWKQTFEKAPEKQNNTEYTQSVNDLIAQYVMSYMNHTCENKRQQDEIEYLEEQIAELKSENQELKTKIDRTKQILY